MKSYRLTNQKQINKEFWQLHPGLSRKKTATFDGKTYCADTRQAFVDFIDMLERNGDIGEKLAQRVTLK